MAPEIVKQTAYTSKADIWSVGCLMVEMLTGTHPWADLTQMQAIFRVSRVVHYYHLTNNQIIKFIKRAVTYTYRLVNSYDQRYPKISLPKLPICSYVRSS